MIDFGDRKIVSELCNLMERFNLDMDDWCVSGECAWLLNGFAIPTRKNHVDIYVKESKLPWEVRDRIQTLPKKGSRELELYSNFVRRSGIGIHLVPLPKPGLTESFIDMYGEKTDFEGFTVKVINPVGNLKDLKLTLELYDLEDIGVERIFRWSEYIRNINSIALKMNKEYLIEETNYLINFINKKSSQHPPR
jgi:hypothetical protein